MELEHQALIYKYIDANVPVPSSLLVAIRKSLGSSVFPSYSPGSLRATECKVLYRVCRMKNDRLNDSFICSTADALSRSLFLGGFRSVSVLE